MTANKLATVLQSSSVTGAEPPVDRARRLVPVLRARSAEIRAAGKIPDDLFEQLSAEGMFRLTTPRILGGLEVDVTTFRATIEELALGDMSVAWVASIMNNAAWGVHALYPRSVVDAVSDAPGGLRACVAAFVRATVRKAPGGYLVEEGMWSFNSGIHHAKWDILPMPLVDDAGNVVDHAFALVPVEQIEIRDDWNVIGLQGTGSASVVARNVFVPDEHVVSASAVLDGRAQRSSSFGGPLYRAASMPVLTISLLFPILGAARRAFELYMERLPTRMIYGLNERQIESSTVHARIGEISAKIDAAGLVVRDDAERIDHAANGTEYMAPLERVRIRRDIGYAVQLVTEAIDALASLYGGSAAREDDEMGRIWRDIRVALLHGGVSPSAGTELHGRLQAGQPGKFAMV